MHLKCPRCENKFDGTPDETDHLACPGCGARLKVRPRPKSTGDKQGSETKTAAPKEQKDATLDAGAKLGGFEVRKLVGRGGMASVYKAIQLSLNRPVAVKVLASRFAGNPVFVQRFEREAGALANLNHPNIVNIIDKGVVDDHYYFVMELVEGITLDQLLHAVELNERHYTHLIGEICKAMTYVHSKGIIHRDIKPSNVLVNKAGMVKVSDFGIAHITDAAMPPERFGKNATVGTANYMAPEQASSPGSVDERADIYSLAVTFFKMFTKQLPLDRKKGASLLNPKLPRSLDPILMRAMDLDPANRYSNVKEFCDAMLECFAVAKRPELVGVNDTSELGGFMFNPSLAAPARTSPDADSSSSSGSSLFMGAFSSVAESSSGFHTPYGVPVQKKVDEEDEAEAEEDDHGGRRLILLIILTIVLLALTGIAAMTWYFYYS